VLKTVFFDSQTQVASDNDSLTLEYVFKSYCHRSISWENLMESPLCIVLIYELIYIQSG